MKRVAILGSGNIGCDLLVKCQREDSIEVVCFAGRHSGSKGLEFAKLRGAIFSDRSIDGILDQKHLPEILLDCTSAAHHPYNYEQCQRHGIRVIDMTPAKLGIACCPVVNLKECLEADNINMISCGGQAAMPICFAIKQANPSISYLEVVSTISSASAGPGTRKNISQYIISTQSSISSMLGIETVKVIINITPAIPPVHMKTSILLHSDDIVSLTDTQAAIDAITNQTQDYVPGYMPSFALKRLATKTICQVQVSGSGDYLPAYAGNLDIINCAAIEVLKQL